MNNDPQSTTDTQKMRRTRISPVLWVVVAALVAVALKLCIALNTEGTNDVVFFHQQFASDLSQHGFEWTYQRRPKFNHPLLVSYFLRGIYSLGTVHVLRENGLTFPFLPRLSGRIADFLVALLMLHLRKRWTLPTWSLLLLGTPCRYVSAFKSRCGEGRARTCPGCRSR